MKRFLDYYLEQEDQNGGNVNGSSDQSGQMSNSEGQINAFKVIAKKYPQETEKFINDIAQKDQDVQAALNSNGPDDGSNQEKDTVVPHSADGSTQNTEGGEGDQ